MTSNQLVPQQLYLVRHGETEWTLSSRHTGCTDISLTARGEDEARQLGVRLRGIAFSHVLTSPRKRAQRTCELAGLEKGAQIEPDLAEWNYGNYEGLCSTDIRKVRADWNLFRDGCPNGESPAQVADRADQLIARLRALGGGNIAIFSHGQFGGVLAARWIGLPVLSAENFPLRTASLSILGFDPHHLEVPVIDLWNSVSNDTRDVMCGPHKGDAVTITQGAIDRWENEGGQIPGPAQNSRTSS
jgi:probable phosphoglycerate mutase